MWKDEEIKATIFIPEGTTIYFEGSSRRFLNDVKNKQDIYDRNMANHHFKMTSKGLDCTDCGTENSNDSNNDDDWNSNNDEDVSFLFDSTINNAKAEFIISKKTTKKELEKLIKWFKNKRNIDINITDSKYDINNQIDRVILSINCNDGYKGELKISNNTLNDISKGFRRIFNEEGKLAFKIW